MTTQTPYGPPGPQLGGEYPTAPPWAQPAEPAQQAYPGAQPQYGPPAAQPRYGPPGDQLQYAPTGDQSQYAPPPQYGPPPGAPPQYGPPGAQPQYDQPQYGQASGGQPQYGQPAYGPPGAQPDYGQSPGGQPIYGQAGGGQAQYVPYGQLNVPFPEAMHAAALPEAPKWWPVVVFTALFGVLGTISAARRAHKAKLLHRDQYPYWLACLLTLLLVTAPIGYVAFSIVRGTVAIIALTGSLEGVDASKVGGPAGEKVTTASCATDSIFSSGTSLYSCTVTTSKGHSGRILVKADGTGDWTLVAP